MYKSLKLIGNKERSVATMTNLTCKDFKEQFMKISKDRFENSPEEIDDVINLMEDISQTDRAKEWRDQLEEISSAEEIVKQMSKMCDSSPGEDGVRLSYLLKGGLEIK